MGYEINFFHKVKHPTKNIDYLIEVYTSLNITYNIREMFFVASGGYSLKDLTNTPRELFEKIISYALLNLNTKDFKEYNSPNGWGTQEGLTRFLVNLLEEVEEKDVDIMEIF